jgi:hypothetical protein
MLAQDLLRRSEVITDVNTFRDAIVFDLGHIDGIAVLVLIRLDTSLGIA